MKYKAKHFTEQNVISNNQLTVILTNLLPSFATIYYINVPRKA